MKRRTLLSLAGGRRAGRAHAGRGPRRNPSRCKILILGGTRFIGLHMTALALSAATRSHSSIAARPRRIVTPRSSASRAIAMARSTGSRIASGTWSSTTRAMCRATCGCRRELLAPKVKQYVFVSSISVYPNFSVPRDESSPVGKLADETVEKVDGETYGPLKALCEQAAEKAMPGRTTRHPARTHRRPRRQHRSLHLLAGACGARRRVHRAGRAHGCVPDHRRARSGGVHAERGREQRHRHIQPRVERQRVQVRRAHRCLHRGGQEAGEAGATRRARPIYRRISSKSRRWSRGARCRCGCPPRATKPHSPAPATRRRARRASRSRLSRRPWTTRWPGT